MIKGSLEYAIYTIEFGERSRERYNELLINAN
jgi:hypothetical protein